MTFSFAGPVPCGRVIRVAALHVGDTVRKIIRVSGLTCHNRESRSCSTLHPELSPLTRKELQGMIRFMMREEDRP